ncbi:hypothetical protein B0H13DRAFT_1904638 [Mycena leptocephala]|nr:hypothetical protein B0H13DRAFT_1904638 [Mycena leptocephala]
MAREKIQGTLWIERGSGSTREHVANRREAIPLLLTAMLTSIVSTSICIAALPSILGGTPIISQDLPCKFSLAGWNITWHNAIPQLSPAFGATRRWKTARPTKSIDICFVPLQRLPDALPNQQLLRTYRTSGAWLTNATAVTSGGLLSWYTSVLLIARCEHLPGHYGSTSRADSAACPRCCPETGVPVQTSVFFNISDVGINVEQSRKCWRVRLHLVSVGSSNTFKVS